MSKLKPKIHIKKENRGKFTDYCGGKVTQNCINKAKKSSNKKLVKRAVFAENARKWSKGGSLHSPFGHKSPLLDSNLPSIGLPSAKKPKK